MKVNVFDVAGPTNHLEVPDSFLKIRVQPALLQQAIVAEAANLRQPIAHTKNRARARGGGRKPWRQKGTGRARASSLRSPLWSGGAATFGLTAERNFSRRLSALMRARAFQMALATKLNEPTVVVYKDFSWVTGKTKDFLKQLHELSLTGPRRLIIGATLPDKLILAARNVAKTQMATADSVRTTDLLVTDALIIDTAGLKALLKRAHNVDVSEPIKEAQPAAKTGKSFEEAAR